MKKIPISEIKNDYIILLAIFKCAGEDSYADTEDIAVTADQLVKGKYRWKKYKKFIDLSLIKTLLANTRDRNKLIVGGKDGWKLNSQGAQIANKLKNQISYSGQRIERRSKFDKAKIDFETQRITCSQAYKKYTHNEKPSKEDIKKIFRVDEYTTQDSVNEYSSILIRLMKGNKEILKFLKTIRKDLLNGTSRV